MAEETSVTTSPMAAELEAKTQKAVKDTGYEAGFDAEVDAILANKAKSEGKPAEAPIAPVPPPTPTPPPPPKPKEPPVKSTILKDLADLALPEELLSDQTKPAPKPPEQTDAEREKFIKEQTQGLSTKAADRFKALEKAKHEAEQKAKRLPDIENELNDAREKLKSAQVDPEKEQLRKRVEEMDEVIKKQALTDHPRFKAHYDIPMAQEREAAAAVLGGDNGKEVAALLMLPESKQRNARLNELAADLTGLELQKFSNAVVQVDRLNAKREAELADWKANAKRIEEISAEEQKSAIEKRKSSITSALNDTLTKFADAKEGIELFRKVNGNEAWNNQVDERVASVKEIMNRDFTPKDLSEMAALSISAGHYRKMFLAQNALLRKLQTELQDMRGAEPEVGSGGATEMAREEHGNLIDSLVGLAVKEGAIR